MKLNKTQLIVSILLPFQLLLVQLISKHPQWIELYYSNGVYPVISKILRSILGWLPISIGDVLGVLFLLYCVRGIFSLLKHKFKNLKNKALEFTTLLSIIYFCFYLFWGLNYFREPLAKNLNLEQTKYDSLQLLTTTKNVIAKLNKYQLAITQNDTTQVKIPYTPKEIYKKANDGYKVLAETYPQFTYENPSVKSSLVSLFQSYNGTAGYINPITNEAQVNSMIPKTGMPATTCHEIAHQIGWSAENEANFIGFLASISNEDLYFRYAGYRMAFHYLYRELKKRNKKLAKEIWNTLNTGVVKDFKASNKHWRKFKNPIEPYLKKGYNSYLKANNQTKGIDSYSYVVDLLISYYEKHK